MPEDEALKSCWQGQWAAPWLWYCQLIKQQTQPHQCNCLWTKVDIHRLMVGRNRHKHATNTLRRRCRGYTKLVSPVIILSPNSVKYLEIYSGLEVQTYFQAKTKQHNWLYTWREMTEEMPREVTVFRYLLFFEPCWHLSHWHIIAKSSRVWCSRLLVHDVAL